MGKGGSTMATGNQVSKGGLIMETQWYEIQVKGQLSSAWSDWFDGMEIIFDSGATQIRGPLNDQAALYGVLARLQSLNLILLSVRCLHADSRDHLPDTS